MRQITFIFLSLFFYTAVSYSQANCTAADQLPIQLMKAELKRGFKTYQKQKPPIYYMSYTYFPQKTRRLGIDTNGVYLDQDIQSFRGWVMARAGSPKMDNSRTLKDGNRLDFVSSGRVPPPDSKDSVSFRRAFWSLTHSMVTRAQRDLNRIQADSQTGAKRLDDSDDFVFPPKSSYCRMQPEISVDTDRIKEMLLRLSNITRGNKDVLDSTFSLSVSQGLRYFVDSLGTELVTPVAEMRLSYQFEGKTADGLNLTRGKSYDVLSEQALPSEEKLRQDMEQSLRELHELTQAPEAEPITVPAILKNRAMAVFVHEVLGHRMEGHRQKLNSFGKTFTSKVGQLVTAPFITIVDDATLASFNGEPLRGFYEYDDEGVKVRPVMLVENGILREFLMSSSPIEGFKTSNGHGRAAPGNSPVARMGVTRLIASQAVSYEELERQLLEEIKKQQKPYGYVIDDLSGGFTMTGTSMPQVFKLEPQYVYRLYPDGRKEVVRGADMVGTPLVSFGKIKAAANDDAVFNGSCGAESGWVPVSAIAPSVLLESLEIEKTAKSSEKPPVLPAPVAVLKEVKK